MGIVDELKKMFNMSESRRRSHVGMDVAFWNAGGLGIIGSFPPQKKEEKKIGNLNSNNNLPDAIIGDTKLNRNQLFEMLRRAYISQTFYSFARADSRVAAFGSLTNNFVFINRTAY